MDWSEVLDPELSPRELLCERLPELHQQRIDQYRRLVEAPMIFSFLFPDSGEQYTLRVTTQKVEAVEGDMIDFPQATARGSRDQWKRCVELVRRLAEPADDQIDRVDGRIKITQNVVDGFEQFDGVLRVIITDLPDDAESLEFEVVLNDYTEPDWAETATVTVQWQVLEDVAHGRLDPVEAARKAKVGGKVGLAIDLGGYFATEFDL